MQNPVSTDEKPLTAVSHGRLLALDIGAKRIGIAISDELHVTTRPLPCIPRTSWKQLLLAIQNVCRHYDVQALVIGLPLHLNGSESVASQNVRRLTRNFALSLDIPVFLQDERLTSHESEAQLRSASNRKVDFAQADSIAASIILEDFIKQQMSSSLST